MSRHFVLQIDPEAIQQLKTQNAKDPDILFITSFSDQDPRDLNISYVDPKSKEVMSCSVRTNPRLGSSSDLIARELLFNGVLKEPCYPADIDEKARRCLRTQHTRDSLKRHQAIFSYPSTTPKSPSSPQLLSQTASYVSQDSADTLEEATPKEMPKQIFTTPSSPTLFKQSAQSAPKKPEKKESPKKCWGICTMC